MKCSRIVREMFNYIPYLEYQNNDSGWHDVSYLYGRTILDIGHCVASKYNIKVD